MLVGLLVPFQLVILITVAQNDGGLVKSKKIWITVGIIGLVVLASSGWIYGIVKSNRDAKAKELAALQVTFVQQYGGKAVIKQLVSPDRVYAAVWVSDDGITHVSWNIGGLWVTVYSSNPLVPAPLP